MPARLDGVNLNALNSLSTKQSAGVKASSWSASTSSGSIERKKKNKSHFQVTASTQEELYDKKKWIVTGIDEKSAG